MSVAAAAAVIASPAIIARAVDPEDPEDPGEHEGPAVIIARHANIPKFMTTSCWCSVKRRYFGLGAMGTGSSDVGRSVPTGFRSVQIVWEIGGFIFYRPYNPYATHMTQSQFMSFRVWGGRQAWGETCFSVSRGLGEEHVFLYLTALHLAFPLCSSRTWRPHTVYRLGVVCAPQPVVARLSSPFGGCYPATLAPSNFENDGSDWAVF